MNVQGKNVHTYAQAGSYTIRQTVVDNTGATASTLGSATVTAPVDKPPTQPGDYAGALAPGETSTPPAGA
jgi:hypothetical protein